jgi:hypothetical protein
MVVSLTYSHGVTILSVSKCRIVYVYYSWLKKRSVLLSEFSGHAVYSVGVVYLHCVCPSVCHTSDTLYMNTFWQTSLLGRFVKTDEKRFNHFSNESIIYLKTSSNLHPVEVLITSSSFLLVHSLTMLYLLHKYSKVKKLRVWFHLSERTNQKQA